jgi:hypothetical protein
MYESQIDCYQSQIKCAEMADESGGPKIQVVLGYVSMLMLHCRAMTIAWVSILHLYFIHYIYHAQLQTRPGRRAFSFGGFALYHVDRKCERSTERLA